MAAAGKTATVAVTGAAGYIGEHVIRRLCEDEAFGRVLGFDVTAPHYSHPKFVFDHLDVRSPALAQRLAGVDALVHLAFIMDPIRDEAAMRDVNVKGSANVLRAAGAAQVAQIVYLSSAVVYGAHRDNSIPLTEDAPLRANLDFSYAAHKLEVEYIVRDLRAEFPQTRFAVLRPAIVFGPRVDNAWSHMLEFPLLVGARSYEPPLQFVHENDVTDAIVFALREGLDGAYNVASEGWLSASQVLALIGRRRFDLGEDRLFRLVDRLWTAGLFEAPSGMVHYVMHPWVVAIDKLTGLGWSPRHGNEETLAAVVRRSRGYMRLGGARLRTVAVAGAVGTGVAGAVGVALARRRARSA